MSVWKGGRGVKAPYQSTHVRIPLPIKDKVEALSQAYKDGILNDDENSILSLEEAIKKSHSILKGKKSARLSMEKLLSAIYGEEVKL